MSNSKCSVCSEQTENKDTSPITGEVELICEDCLEQIFDQIQETEE